MRLAGEVNRERPGALAVNAVFLAPTVAAMAGLLKDDTAGRAAPLDDLEEEVDLDPSVVPRQEAQ